MAAKWTVMVYMAANNDLSLDAGDDLTEMRTVGSTDNVQLLAFTKQRGNGEAYRRRITRDGKDEVAEKLENVDSGDPQTVLDFVLWAAQTAPADKYALILWNHGTGWAPEDIKDLYHRVKAGSKVDPGVTQSEINQRANQPVARSFFSTTIKEIMAQPSQQARAILSDDGTGHSLDTIELGRVMGLARKQLGRPIDLLGMDACLMSTLEVAYELRDFVHVIVGSETIEPNAGWAYNMVLSDLNANPEIDAAALGKIAVDRYIEANKSDTDSATQCAVETAHCEPFAEAIDTLQKVLVPQLPQFWPKVQTAQAKSVRFRGGMVDLSTFCQNLVASSLDDSIKCPAQAVLEALKPGAYVIDEGHQGPDVTGCGGITVYLPAPTEPISPYYKDLRFAKEHQWDELLQAYQQAVMQAS